MLGVLLAVGPLLNWRREGRPILKKVALPGLFAATALVIAFFAIPQASILSKLGVRDRTRAVLKALELGYI